MGLFRRREQPAAAPPRYPFRDTTVGGFGVRVHELPGSVCAFLDGRILQQLVAVRPRGRTEPDPRVHPAAQAWLTVFDATPHPATTGDAAFDARYEVHGALNLVPAATLTDPLRTVLLAHDIAVLIAQRHGAWVAVGVDDPAGRPAAEAAALEALGLLVQA